jgi:hypothetical protein
LNEGADQIIYNRIRNAEAYVVFAIPEYVPEIARKYLPAVRFFHQSTPLIESIFLNRRNKKDQVTVYLDVSKSLFDIVVIENKKLILYNCFSFRDENDLIYFVLYVFEQLKLDPEKTELYLSGIITRRSRHYENLRKYIRHIYFDSPNPQFTYSYTFNQIPSHTFLNLLNLSSCE